MQTYKTGVEFTGFLMMRHQIKSCGAATRIEVGIDYPAKMPRDTFEGFPQVHATLAGHFSDTGNPHYRYTATCSGCGVERDIRHGEQIFGRFVESVRCGARCTNALGPSCDCTCGGKNHGSGH